MYSKQELLKIAADLTKKIDSGKLKGKALHKAKKRVYWAKWRAGKVGQQHVKGATSKPRKSKAKPIIKEQGILPGFLSQLNTVRIEELVAERMFNALAENLKLSISSNAKKVAGE